MYVSIIGYILCQQALTELEEKYNKEAMKRLDGLEKKLSKMMEGLSIRSLRHMRHIKSELRQVRHCELHRGKVNT